MKNINPVRSNSISGASIFADWNHLFRGAIALEPDDGAGKGDDEEAKKAAEKAAADEAAKKAAEEEAKKKADDDKKKTSDEEAKLLKEVMKRKKEVEDLQTKLKAFDGIDPEEIKKLVDEKKEAEKAKREAEKKAAEAAGNIDALKKMMAEEHEKTVSELNKKIAEFESNLKSKDSTIIDLTIGQEFSVSKFIKDELVLTPAKARAVYGSHFEIKDGEIVAYDKPAGASTRTELVDGKGQHLTFEAALRKLVDIDPDRDHVLRSKMQSGAGSKTMDGKSKTPASDAPRGIAAITNALNKGALSKSK
jgi:hypothetical protein